MEPHQERVIDEKRELSERIAKLGAFVQGNTFVSIPSEEQKRLNRQLAYMGLYNTVLAERIEAFD